MRHQLATRILTASLLMVLIVSMGMSFFYSQAISSIKVTALDETSEPLDAVLIGVGKENALPDYRLEILGRDGRVFDLGTFPNQSAVQGLTWSCNETIPRSAIASIRLVEQDPISSDTIEEVVNSGNMLHSDNYHYQLFYERSLFVGMTFFLFSTPIGWVLVGISVVIGIWLASNICVP